MKKAIVTGICSFVIVLMALAMPVYAEGDTSSESAENNFQPSVIEEESKKVNLAELYNGKKLIAEYESSFVYTGDVIEPKVTLYMKDISETGEEKTIEFDSKYYDVTYNNNLNAGNKAEIIITAKEITKEVETEETDMSEVQEAEGNEEIEYEGSFTVYFTIKRKPLEGANYNLAYGSTVYTGANLTPEVTVELDGKKLVNNQDYSVLYSGNKEIGTATVVITGKGNYEGSKQLTFKIVLAAPELSAVAAYNKVTVKWTKVAGATKYVLERSTSKTSGFKKIAEIKNGSTVKYEDKKVTFNKTYYYRVRAYRNSVKSSYSAVVSQKVKPATAKISKVSRASYNSLKVTWKKVSGASGYAIYRSTSEKGTYKKIATVKSGKKLTYTDKKRSCGTTYYYKVAAYRKSKGKNYYGSKSDCVAAKTIPAKVSLAGSTGSDDTKVKLTWKKSSGATGYMIYRSTEKSSGYVELKNVTKAKTVTWTDSGLDEKQVYFYKIRPYVVRNGEKIYGSYSSVFKKELVSEKEKALTKYTSVSYRWGGDTPAGWDCSGFTKWAMKYIYGIEIGSNSAAQAAGGKSVSKSDRSKWQFGDILVYSSGGRVNHVALYIGNNKIMHALNSKYDTIIHDVDYYENWDKKNNLKCVRRYH